MRRVEEAHGWGLRISGPNPYLAYYFKAYKESIEITEPYYRAVKVVLISLAEWQRLKKLDDAEGGKS